MHRGYVKLWRRIEDSGLLQDAPLFACFSYLLIRSTWKPRKVALKNHGIVELGPGQVIVGRKMMSADLRLGEQVVRRCIKKLEKLQILTTHPTNGGTVVTICNWQTYQSDDEATNHQVNHVPTSDQPAANQRPTTTQEVKQDSIEALKKREQVDKPPPRPRFVPPTKAEVRAYMDGNGTPIDADAFCDHFTSNGWKVGGKTKMKDWQSAARNWYRRDCEKRGKSHGTGPKRLASEEQDVQWPTGEVYDVSQVP